MPNSSESPEKRDYLAELREKQRDWNSNDSSKHLKPGSRIVDITEEFIENGGSAIGLAGVGPGIAFIGGVRKPDSWIEDLTDQDEGVGFGIGAAILPKSAKKEDASSSRAAPPKEQTDPADESSRNPSLSRSAPGEGQTGPADEDS